MSGEYSEKDITEFRRALAESFRRTDIAPEAKDLLQIRSSLELIVAIGNFDEASGRLVETTNALTRKGLLFGAVAIAVSLASLGVSR